MNDRRYVKSVVAVGLLTAVPLVIGWLGSAVSARAEAGLNEQQDMETLIRRLTARDPREQKEREQAAEAIRNQRRELIGKLIQLAQETVKPLPSSDPRFVENPWHDSKHLSILLLGDLRASEAVPVLVTQLEYINPRELEGSARDQSTFHPAAEALSKVGMPAVDPTVEKLASLGPKNKSGALCCWILRKTLGVKLGRARLQIAIDETRSEAAKANLKAALPYFRTPQEEAAEERAKQEQDKPVRR
jgi:hypothetical protein